MTHQLPRFLSVCVELILNSGVAGGSEGKPQSRSEPLELNTEETELLVPQALNMKQVTQLS